MKRSVIFYMFWPFLITLLSVRIWQVCVVIDQSGFYLPGYASLGNGLDLVFWGVVFALALIARLALKGGDPAPVLKSRGLGIASLVLAVFCIPQALSDYQLAANQTAMVLGLLPSVLTAVSFVVMGSCRFAGKKIPFGASILPAASELVRVIWVYTHFNGISRISENVVYILFLVSFVSFCTCHCRVHFASDRRKGMNGCYAFGICTGVFGLLSTLPHWLFGHNVLPLSFLGMGAAVYAVAFMAVNATDKPVAEPAVQELAVETVEE